MQMFGVIFFGLTIPISSKLADRYGRRSTQMVVMVAIILFGLCFGALFGSGSQAVVLLFLSVGLGLMGLCYGPLGAMLSELFPTKVRYTGASLTFNLAGIFGASLAPYAATYLATNYGLRFVGYYLAAAAAITLGALVVMRETRDESL
jgi:MFS family permease